MSKTFRTSAVWLFVILLVSTASSRVGADFVTPGMYLHENDVVYSDGGNYQLKVHYRWAYVTESGGMTLAITYKYLPTNEVVWDSINDEYYAWVWPNGSGVHHDQWGYTDQSGFAVMQDDGNFVLYSSAYDAVWETRTYGYPGSSFKAQGDGNLMIITPWNTAIWSLF